MNAEVELGVGEAVEATASVIINCRILMNEPLDRALSTFCLPLWDF